MHYLVISHAHHINVFMMYWYVCTSQTQWDVVCVPWCKGGTQLNMFIVRNLSFDDSSEVTGITTACCLIIKILTTSIFIDCESDLRIVLRFTRPMLSADTVSSVEGRRNWHGVHMTDMRTRYSVIIRNELLHRLRRHSDAMTIRKT